jgi:hypothetical protein
MTSTSPTTHLSNVYPTDWHGFSQGGNIEIRQLSADTYQFRHTELPGIEPLITAAEFEKMRELSFTDFYNWLLARRNEKS